VIFARWNQIMDNARATSSQSITGCAGRSRKYTATGKIAAAVTLANETYPDSDRSATQTATTTPSARGAIPSIAPAAVATPFPPLNPTKTENTWPTTAVRPQARANSGESETRGANTTTGQNPFAASKRPTGTATRQPSTR
jgi:hypothetical protein